MKCCCYGLKSNSHFFSPKVLLILFKIEEQAWSSQSNESKVSYYMHELDSFKRYIKTNEQTN